MASDMLIVDVCVAVLWINFIYWCVSIFALLSVCKAKKYALKVNISRKKNIKSSYLKSKPDVMFALSGLQVCPKLQKHSSHLLSNPSIMMKTWAKWVGTLIQTLFSVFVNQKMSFQGRNRFLSYCCVIAASGCSPGQKLCWERWCQKRSTAETPCCLSGKLKINVRIQCAWHDLPESDLPSCYFVMFDCVFFSSCRSVVCILPVVTWSHASRSRQKLASDMKAYN